MKGYVNFGDISKTIPDELCNMGGGFHQQRRESTGEAFFIDLSPFRDERFKGSGGLYGSSFISSSLFPCTLWNLTLSVFTSQNSAKER